MQQIQPVHLKGNGLYDVTLTAEDQVAVATCNACKEQRRVDPEHAEGWPDINKVHDDMLLKLQCFLVAHRRCGQEADDDES